MSTQQPSLRSLWDRFYQIRDIEGAIAFEFAQLSGRSRPKLAPGATAAIEALTSQYYRRRITHLNHPEGSTDDDFISDVGILLISLSQDGKVFVRGRLSLSLRVATRLLVDKGWIATKRDADILRALRDLNLREAGVLGTVTAILRDSFVFENETHGRGFEDVRTWAKDQPWWQSSEAGFKEFARLNFGRN